MRAWAGIAVCLLVGCGGAEPGDDLGDGSMGGSASETGGTGYESDDGPSLTGGSDAGGASGGAVAATGGTATGGSVSTGGSVATGGQGTGGAIPEECEGWQPENLEQGECLVILGYAKMGNVCPVSGEHPVAYCRETSNAKPETVTRWLLPKPGNTLTVYRGTWNSETGNCSADAQNNCGT